MKKLVIFDLDGTLLNTIADLAAATNQALQYYGYPTHETEAYRFFVGNGINKLFERALPEGERTEENVLKIRSQFIPYYDEHNADLSRPYPGISELLKTLQQQGIMIAVASNKYQAATRKLIAHYFPEINFVEVLGQREGIPAKPDPSIVNEIMTKAGVKQEDILYVGDANSASCRSNSYRCGMGIPPAHRIGSLASGSHHRKSRRITSTSPFMIIFIKYIIHQAP